MTRKIAVNNNEVDFDQNIVDALLRLKSPIIGLNDVQFYIRDKARKESGLEHIANRKHHLKVRDIDDVPKILKKPSYSEIDPLNKSYKNYYGPRTGNIKKRKENFIKIVTHPLKKNKEKIITIYPTATIPIE